MSISRKSRYEDLNPVRTVVLLGLDRLPLFKLDSRLNSMVDVPRFELGASSMPRKRASKLRHTPSEPATCDAHLRRMAQAPAWTKQVTVTYVQRPHRCRVTSWTDSDFDCRKRRHHSSVISANISVWNGWSNLRIALESPGSNSTITNSFAADVYAAHPDR